MSALSFGFRAMPGIRDWPGQVSAAHWLALTAIVILAAGLRFANLAALGHANHYYSAAVVSMLQSWHNFFFVAAEPGGAVSVDKPPLGLWLQAASAAVFGVTGFGVLLPQIVAGVLSVIIVYHLVRRPFGAGAGLVAALALAVTPVSVATDRNNTMDSTLVLTLLLAAWAFIVATRTGRLRFLLLGAALVGIGFNIKMLQAFLPLPAFLALYLLGGNERLWRKLANLGLMALALAVISAAWIAVVDLTPVDQRPYVGGSADNSALNLMIGYNGAERLLGIEGRGGLLSGLLGGASGAPGAGLPGVGQPGPLRLLTPPLSKEMSWLLPFGLASLGLLAARARPRWPLAPRHQAIVLWGGWLLTGAIFFSVAGFFHEYYLSTIAPPLAALVGIGVGELWRLCQERPWLASLLLAGAGGGTLAFQVATAAALTPTSRWLPVAVGMLVVGAALLVAAASWSGRKTALAGVVTVMAALLLTPVIWSGLTVANASRNQLLPSAYGLRPSGPVTHPQINQALLDYLQARTQDVRYLLAVPSSMQGADYVLATGRPVLYLGGFNGQDRVATADGLARMVAGRDLRFVFWNERSGAPGTGIAIATFLATTCVVAPGFEAVAINAATPSSGTSASSRAVTGRGDTRGALYDCAPAAGG